MIKMEDECVDCTSIGLRCKGRACPNRNVPHFYCDACGRELSDNELYDVDGDMLCDDCTLERLKTKADRWL